MASSVAYEGLAVLLIRLRDHAVGALRAHVLHGLSTDGASVIGTAGRCSSRL